MELHPSPSHVYPLNSFLGEPVTLTTVCLVTMKIDTEEAASIDEERVKALKQVDLANNVQARYASLQISNEWVV